MPSLWVDTAGSTRFPPLGSDLSVDVAIVGGGITGVTAAALLARGGRSVALLEMARVGMGETGRTTAHLTEAVDARYRDLVADFGKDGARLVAESSRAAIAQIEDLMREHDIACDFRRLPGYLYTEKEDIDVLEEELEAARRAGVRVELTREVPLPFRTSAALRFDQQAEFHPLRYLVPLAEALARAGIHVFEGTKVANVVDGEPCRVETERGTVTARDVLVAANVPVNNRVLLHTKIAAYRSYVVAGPIEERLEGLFWDTADPYHYVRTQPLARGAALVVGGADHKVGKPDETGAPYEYLEGWVRSHFGPVELTDRWSGQIIEPVDGLPFIGRNSLSSHVHVATGYSGNGMTFGALAGMIVTNAILGRDDPWAALYAATRVKPLAAAVEYVRENVDFPRHLVADRLTNLGATASSADEVRPGEGRIVACGGEKYAVHRDTHGTLHVLSPVCTHLGCDVRWNAAERSWDCPCHGSRFTPEGAVLNGPAVRELSPKELPAGDRPRRSA